MPIFTIEEAIEAVTSIISFIEADTTLQEVSDKTLNAGRAFLASLERDQETERELFED